MLGLLLLAFLIVPILELYLFFEVASAVGFGPALFWIVAVSAVGAWMVKREGTGALRRANRKVAGGKLPTDELVNGILIVLAGALMLTPGFLTDAAGLLMLFPPTRALLRRPIQARFASGPVVVGQRFSAGFGARGGRPPRAGRDDVMDADSWEDPPDRPGLR